jgi:hypothetical protein
MLEDVDFVVEVVAGGALELAGVAVAARGVGYGCHPAGVGGAHRRRASVGFCRNQIEWLSLVAMFLVGDRVNLIDESGGPGRQNVSIRPAD